mgnify:CR=1 FL=1
MTSIIRSLGAAGALALLAAACSPPPPPTPNAAAATTVEFRVVPTDRNPSSCQRWDADLSRVHTVTRSGDTATLRTAGGIARPMAMTAPNVFTTTMTIGGVNFDVVANAAPPPGSLDISEPRTGCRWSAIAR